MGLQLKSRSSLSNLALQNPALKKKSQVEFTVAHSTTVATTGKHAQPVR